MHNLTNLTVGQQVLVTVAARNSFGQASFNTTVTGGDVIFEYHSTYPTSGYGDASKIIAIEATSTSMTIDTDYISTMVGQSVATVLTSDPVKGSGGNIISIQLIGRQGVFRAYNAENKTLLVGNSTTTIDNTSVQLDILTSGGYTSGFKVTTTLPFQYAVLDSAGTFDNWVTGTSGGTIPAYQDTSILLKF